MQSNLIAPHLQAFFAEYLCQQRRLSPQTIGRCRDTCRLFLTFLRDQTGIEPSALRIADVDAPAVLSFLQYLEQQRNHAIRSRHMRLSALRSFCRLVAWRAPASVGMVTGVMAMPMTREDRQLINYLPRTELQALLAAPARSKWGGRRADAVLLTRYNSGARVADVIALRRAHVRFEASTCVQLLGKGRNERTVPLWPDTAQVLQAWLRELGAPASGVAFPNARGKPLSRDGVDSLLKQALPRAVTTCPSRTTKNIAPHVVRHTTAMHLRQAGVDIATMALWRGHASMETTHMSLHAALAMQEQALEKRAPIGGPWQRFHAAAPLLACLSSL